MSAIIAAAEFVKALSRSSPQEQAQAWAIIRAVEPKSERRIAAGRANAAKRYGGGNESAVTTSLPPRYHPLTSGNEVVITSELPQDLPPLSDSPLPLASDSPNLSQQIENGYVTEAAELPAPARRVNRVVLLDEFAGAVNVAGPGTWARPRGQVGEQIGEALGLAVAKHEGRPPVAVVRELGARWVRYCGGAPDDGLRVVSWLGKGAPEEPAPRLMPGVKAMGAAPPRAKLPPQLSIAERQDAAAAAAKNFDPNKLRG